MRRRAEQAVEEYDVRPGDVDAPAGSLSGGNMQKLVIARELMADPRVLVASSPSWGLDVGAVGDVQRRLIEARDGGCAILLNSLDLDEVIALSDRVLVMYRGRITLDVTRADLDMAVLSMAMIGGDPRAGGTPPAELVGVS